MVHSSAYRVATARTSRTIKIKDLWLDNILSSNFSLAHAFALVLLLASQRRQILHHDHLDAIACLSRSCRVHVISVVRHRM